MSDVTDKAEDAKAAEEPESAGSETESFVSRMVGVVVLIVVFGILYLLAKAMPMASDAVGQKLDGLVGDDVVPYETTEAEVVEVVPTVVETEEAVATEPVVREGDTEKTDLMRQVAESFPDPDMVEVMFVGFSEDREEMVAMVKLLPEAKPVDYLLKRDKFGRYVSDEGAEVEMKIVPVE